MSDYMECKAFLYLDKIEKSKDIKKLSIDELKVLCEEIRTAIISTVAENGGHLASNLGVVELTVAMHYVFDMPEDSIVFDVGHQCYTHKLLTGRRERISTIRRKEGLSGFPRRDESEYDAFGAGHSSTSISAAFGIAKAKALKGDTSHTIALIGDGSFTGGLAFEGINNAGRFKKNFIVVLNDNKMSISKNVGAFARYLTGIRVSPWYINAKSGLERFLNKVPLIGKPLVNLLTKLKNNFKKRAIKSNNLFENFGFFYYGPVDGHDLEELINTFKAAKKVTKPVFIHAVTVKGKGYGFAEKDPKNYHGIGKFDVDSGEPLTSAVSYSDIFGKCLCHLANQKKTICAITAAMTMGTGLTEFSHKFKDRFFDVGIAEEHAVTFGAGLASQGMIPVFAVYSTFLQRAYDQLIHDVSLQKLHVVLGIDRAGIVGEDGETHQGVFDVSMLNSIPNTTCYSPCYFDELASSMEQGIIRDKNLVAVRYPRGSEPYRPEDYDECNINYSVYGNKNASRLIVTYGRLFADACIAKRELSKVGIEVCILKLCRIKPIDAEAVKIAAGFKKVHFFEEGMLTGGIGESFGYLLSEAGFIGKYGITAVDDRFVPHASVKESMTALKFNSLGIYDIMRR